MNTTFKTSFFRDVKKSPVVLHPQIDSVIIQIENAKSLKEILNLKKLKGHKTAYRVKIEDYRLCFYFESETVEIVRFLPRRDVYRVFP